MLTSRPMPASLSAAAVTGWIGGALAWAITSGWTDTTWLLSSYARLDQYVALTIGACTGACILAMRARHRREPIWPAVGAGVLLGGVAALLGATVGLWVPARDTPAGFVFARMTTWALMAALASTALSTFTRVRRIPSLAMSAVLGALGGAIAGALFSLPGPSDVWLPTAMTWCGTAIGFAAVGPAMWRAPAVIQILPPRHGRASLWSLHECAIEDGWSMQVVDAQLGCVDGVLFVYPPPAGAVLDGYPLYRAVPLVRDATIVVGRVRARATLRHRS